MSIALMGNPNAGKTSLFNALTGLNQQVGNYPGVTVDKKTGYTEYQQIGLKIIDVPGTYSVSPSSPDEKVALDIVLDKTSELYPDIVLYIADVSNLKRSLLLFTQLADLGLNLVLGLNMVDIAKKANIQIDVPALSKELGVEVVEINARNGEGIESLKKALISFNRRPTVKQFVNPKLGYQESLIQRSTRIKEILAATQSIGVSKLKGLQFLDRILLHRVYGLIVFFVLMLLIFQSVFVIAEYPMNWIEDSFSVLGEQVSLLVPDGILQDLLVDGIIAGLAGVLVFIPQIAMLFFFIGIMEDTGYMARVSFMMDRVLHKFGLHGKSAIPLMSGMACAIPAVMSARTISNSKDRLITILVTPLVTCSARLPVYVLMISLIVPSGAFLGVVSYKGLVLMGMYLLGFVATLLVAIVFKKILKSEESSYFIMDMPTYKLPRWKSIGLTMYEKVKVFTLDAGKIILAISILLWILSTNGPTESFKAIEQQVAQGVITDNEAATLKLEESYIGIMGKGIEPLVAPMGFNWQLGISLITSFAAREVFVGSMATIYSVGDEEDIESIREKMSKEIDPATQQPFYSVAVGISLLVFYAFAMQCMSTLAIVYRETKSWKWPAVQLVVMTGMAYISSVIVYQILS